MRRLFAFAALLLAATISVSVSAAAESDFQFRASFQVLAEMIPSKVGTPVDEEEWQGNGDLWQHTTTGLMVWRESDRWTAFTDGATTWILGPSDLRSRPNDGMFPWEVETAPSDLPDKPAPATTPSPGTPPTPITLPAPTPTPRPVPAAVAAPAPPPTSAPPAAAPPAPTPTPPPTPLASYQPDVKAMDDLAGGHGVMVKTFIQAIDGEWSRAWGWRPHRPVTIYLYTSGYGLAQGLTQITGAVLSPAD